MKLLGLTFAVALLMATTIPASLARDLGARLIIAAGIYFAATAGRE